MSTPGSRRRAAAPSPDEPPAASPSDPETGKAIGLAAATMAANLVAVVFTVIFTRILGADGYGSLAALLNLTVILLVPGSALQVAAAREATLGRLGRGGELAGDAARAGRRHILVALVRRSPSCSVLAREPLADADEHRPGVGGGRRAGHRRAVAAAVPPARAAAVGARLPRGRAERPVRGARPAASSAIVLVAAGLGVTGAYLGTLGVDRGRPRSRSRRLLRRRLGPPDARRRARHPLRALARDAALPIAALTLVAALQNVDVIMAKHVLDRHARPASTRPPTVAAKARGVDRGRRSASGCCRRRPAAPPRARDPRAGAAARARR